MESESGTADTKVSDSGYCNSNSNSRRSASSKSRHSGSNSSRSSGYCGAATNPDGSVGDIGPLQPKRKEKEHKKRKLKSTNTNSNFSDIFENSPAVIQNERNPKEAIVETPNAGVEIAASPKENTTPDVESLEKITIVSEKTLEHQIEQKEEEKVENNDDFWIEEKIDEQEKIEIASDEGKLEPKSPGVPNEERDFQSQDGFCCVISIFDGVVLYTTPSLSSILGFPKDMWLGRSFIDFVHPKDREIFSSQVTTVIALPLVNSHETKNSLYVCLRKYRGLKSSGFGVVEKTVSYQAFQLTVTFKKLAENSESTKYADNMFLVVVGIPLYSAYKTIDERKKSPKFGMRHTAACIFSHVDPDVVTNFGFLPQDMLGKSVFDFYHPEDMPFMKEIYESVMGMRQISGTVFRSKPYRFAVQNGGFAMIETEWSSFINPWSRRLEFVIGLHRVLQGPKNPNIFDTPKDDEIKQISEESVINGKNIQGEILLLLKKELTRPSETAKLEVSKRCKDLANFMESLMDEVKKCSYQLELQQDSDPTTLSEQGSVMLGGISPHHDYYDSKSSSETPPSYNQLNYNDNIQRFFQSKPKTTISDGSGDRLCVFANTDADIECKASSSGLDSSQNTKCLSPIRTSGTSASGSGESFGSNLLLASTTTGATSSDSYKPPHLTEAILHKHNEDMEKILLKKHKEYRTTTKEGKKNTQKDRNLYNSDKPTHDLYENVHIHGIKRAGSLSWEEDNHKVSKHKHQLPPSAVLQEQSTNTLPLKQTNVHQQNLNTNNDKQTLNDVNLWPPFSVTVSPISNAVNGNVTTTSGTTAGVTAGMIPVCYSTTSYQVHYMPGMIYNYNTIVSTPSIVCSPLPVVPLPVQPSQDAHLSNGLHNITSGSLNLADPNPSASGAAAAPQFRIPASQAMNLTAEPVNAIGSFPSANGSNKALSECSRRNLGLSSVCSPSSPLVSLPDGDVDLENYKINIKKKESMKIQHGYQDNTVDEGSTYYSSSHSSSMFNKTDTGSGSNDDSNTMDLKILTSDDNSWRKNKNFPIRKRAPPWLNAVSVTPDLVYRYQMAVKGIEDILQEDLKTLKGINQPTAVNEQLNQLYLELELDGLSKNLTLDEGGLTSSSSSDEQSFTAPISKKKRRSYSSLMMIYEENAPLPPPDE